MADVHSLLEQFIAEHRSGGRADPGEWVDRVQGSDRAKLSALVDAYLERAPMREWDADAFRESGLALFAEQVNSALYSEAGNWPVVLPALRDKARLKRSDLSARLASALGAGDQQEKVASYYHQMERGLLPAKGVNDRVLDALSSIVGQSAEALRRAGRAVGGTTQAPGAPPGLFARQSRADPDAVDALTASAPASPTDADWDEVDRLFRGG